MWFKVNPQPSALILLCPALWKVSPRRMQPGNLRGGLWGQVSAVPVGRPCTLLSPTARLPVPSRGALSEYRPHTHHHRGHLTADTSQRGLLRTCFHLSFSSASELSLLLRDHSLSEQFLGSPVALLLGGLHSLFP